jgi:hypothetical protein
VANYTGFIKRFLNLDVKTIIADIREKKDPEVMLPNGSQIYHGYQGEGKTLSMYHHFTKLKEKYPQSLAVTNLKIKGMKGHHPKTKRELEELLLVIDRTKEYILFESHAELIMLLRNDGARNGYRGVIFMIDEIHNYFHSHDSKSMPMWVVQVFSQQRKQRLVILGTVQDWEDVIKAIRRQVDNLIECKKLGYIIRNTAIDPRTFEMEYGERSATIRKKGFFFITKRIRDGFDTYQVINSGREIMGGNDLQINVNNTEKKNKWRR